MSTMNPLSEKLGGGAKITTETLRLLRKAAETGHAEAQYRLGMLHANGEGVTLDYREAAQWIEKAAKQDLAEAQAALGWLYANGLGAKQDGEAAGHWYLKSAQQGVASSQYLVASMYRVGSNGFEQCHRSMLRWYHRAAEQNFAPAQNMLGKLMARGKLVTKDVIGAFQWFSLALLNGSDSAKQELSKLMEEMSQDQVEEAKRIFIAAMQAQGVDIQAFTQAVDAPLGHTF